MDLGQQPINLFYSQKISIYQQAMDDIFVSVPNWRYTQNDEKGEKIISELREEARVILPSEQKSNKIITIFQEIKPTKLYSVLKLMPKGCLHHLHFDCADDQDFVAQHIISDPIVYLSQNLNSFHLGTQEQAQKNGWVSMSKARLKFNNQKDFINHVSNITMFDKNDLLSNFTQGFDKCWKKFEQKICNFFPILEALHLFRKYSIHILRKFVKNGYDRIQFRSFNWALKQYNQKGEIIKNCQFHRFMQIFDQAYALVKKQHPPLSVGFIFFGLKFFSAEQNIQNFTKILQKNWDKTIGIDFVQQEDKYGSLQPYDKIADQILDKFKHQNIKKVYHAGETKDHLNNNIEISINAGTVRIGHGINIFQYPHLIQICKQKKICFQKNPVSNIILGYTDDPRINSVQVLLALGIPVSISPDDPARFGLQDSTMDFFVSFLSSNWSLKHLKLLAYHSINHSICSENTKKQLIQSFNKRWDTWVISL